MPHSSTDRNPAEDTPHDPPAAPPEIEAGVPLLEPPGWAVAQRALFDLLDHAWRRFARDFTGPDGRLNYSGPLTTRDGVDDFYEVFFNWPQLYLLGGADDLLPASEKHWEGVTRQLTELDMMHDEFERGYDWFHQGESLLLLYFLSMAAPDRWSERALCFAELYVDPAKGNYDPEYRLITRPHNGSDPDRTGLFDGDVYPWLLKEAETYGFPLDWIPEADGGPHPLSADPRLGAQMRDRMGVGDTAVNLAAAGLVLNAWILSGEDRYRDWIVDYVGAWRSAPWRTAVSSRTTSARTASSAACWRAAGTAATTAGPGRTAGTAWATRPVWRRSRRPRSPGTTTTSPWSRPPSTPSSATPR